MMAIISSSKKIQGWNLALQVLAILSFIFLAVFMSVSDRIEAFRLLTRLTARISLIFFSMAFVASSTIFLWPRSQFLRWMAKNRRYLGVCFAISHFFHLAAIVGVSIVDTEKFLATTPWTTFVFGGLVYVFIFFMLVTSFDRSALWVSAKTWKLGHKVGSYGIWFIFMVSYFGRLLEARWVYAFPALLILATALLRALAWKKKRSSLA